MDKNTLNKSKDEDTIKLGDLINEEEVKDLLDFLSGCDIMKTTHNCVMTWLDKNQQVCERFAQNNILKAYGAYMLEHYLELSEYRIDHG